MCSCTVYNSIPLGCVITYSNISVYTRATKGWCMSQFAVTMVGPHALLILLVVCVGSKIFTYLLFCTSTASKQAKSPSWQV